MIPSLHSDHVRETPELDRVRGLPRRPDVGEELPELRSRYLRLDHDNPVCPVCHGAGAGCGVCGSTGRIVLRPRQAEALREAYDCRGLFAPMRVGSGKTLVTLLLPTVLKSERPVLIIPASLRDKTIDDFAKLRRAWRVRCPTILSYEEMGRPDRDSRLADIRPDLLILDEAHRARNWSAAVTRRIQRYVSRREVTVAALSGTLITDSVLDFHHLAVWSLGNRAPVPIPRAEAERWAQALDRQATLRRIGSGALETLGDFYEHLRSRRGVVPTPGSDCDASIECDMWAPDLSPELRGLIERTAVSSLRPDGEILDEWELPDCLCQLAQGFFYVWDPLPPSWWLEPRRAWNTYVRAVLDEHLDGFDSPSQIANALDGEGGKPPAPTEGRILLDAWREVRDRFTPNTVPIWLDHKPLAQAAEHAREHDAIVWVRHVAAGVELDRVGVPYFGADTNPTTSKTQAIACSVAAHGTGKNLQAWAANLILTPIANANGLEQLMGRTHRAGQKADAVRFWFPGTIDYHAEVLGRVLTEARAVSKASGFSQKLTEATWIRK